MSVNSHDEYGLPLPLLVGHLLCECQRDVCMMFLHVREIAYDHLEVQLLLIRPDDGPHDSVPRECGLHSNKCGLLLRGTCNALLEEECGEGVLEVLLHQSHNAPEFIIRKFLNGLRHYGIL